MNVLIFGAQTNIGMQLIQDLDAEITAVFVYSTFIENDKVVEQVNRDRSNVTALDFIHGPKFINGLFSKNKFDYILNCHREPFEIYSNLFPCEDLSSYSKVAKLAEASRVNGFEGCFMNLSTFEIYGDSSNGMPLELKEGRFEIKEPSSSEDIFLEDRFGYDCDLGLSEKMYYSPSNNTICGLHADLCEKIVKHYSKGPVLNLRLPYMPVHSVPDDFILKYGDRINVILLKLSKGQEIQTTLDNSEKCVYDFLTPGYVSRFICSLIFHGEVMEGDFNMSGVSFSELELLKKLQEFNIKIKFLKKTPIDWHKPLRYYKADDSALKNALKDKLAKLPDDFTLQSFILNYLDRK
jgi:hypothetical protein